MKLTAWVVSVHAGEPVSLAFNLTIMDSPMSEVKPYVLFHSNLLHVIDKWNQPNANMDSGWLCLDSDAHDFHSLHLSYCVGAQYGCPSLDANATSWDLMTGPHPVTHATTLLHMTVQFNNGHSLQAMQKEKNKSAVSLLRKFQDVIQSALGCFWVDFGVIYRSMAYWGRP